MSATGAERQALSIAMLRNAGGKRISISLPSKSVTALTKVMRNLKTTSQTEAVIHCIDLAKTNGRPK